MTELPLVERLRLDKWLWATRLCKTRSLAAEEIVRGRVRVGGQPVKPAREVKAGDRVELRQQGFWRELVVQACSPVRGPAPLAQALYAETPQSVQARQQDEQVRRLAAEPARAIEQGRPTKRDRRAIDSARGGWRRWSASIDDE
ncbi:MAG TPA: RNA-binding S4 domain-containing protein [Rubrivivax sp.]|nr:RNA-binding S4 domain-containing protein [Rubrivivax sp.]HMR69197.1 RNA-binding S4 domain-containing protein [Rubrivivax sp.]